MKLVLYFKLFCSLISILKSEKIFNFNLPSNKLSPLVDALDEIVNEFLSVRKLTVNLVWASDEISDGFKVKDFTQELLTKNLAKFKVTFRRETSTHIKTFDDHRRRSGIFIFETFNEFCDIYSVLNATNFRFNGFFCVILVSGKISEIEEIFKLLWNLQIYHAILLFQDESGAVEVQTFMPFNPGNCNNTSPVVINKFKDGKFMNNVKFVFPKKLKNLSGCTFRVATSNGSEPFVIARKGRLSGRDIDLVQTLAESLKFKINFTFVGEEGFLYENGTAAGPMNELMNGRADFIVADLWIKLNRLKFFDSTTVYASEQLALVTPPGRGLTEFEKLFFPFSTLVWVLILTILFVGSGVILFVIKFSSKPVQHFVFGTDVRNPFLNMLTGMIGGTQPRLPKRNFARFLLMVFLMFSLIIRTLFQGSFYQLLHSNERHKEVQTIDEMIEKDFKFLIFGYTFDLFQGTEKISSR